MMLAWARANPSSARIALRFVVRLVIALAVVLPARGIGDAYGVSPNVGAIGAVAVALLLGGRLADRLAAVCGIPPV